MDESASGYAAPQPGRAGLGAPGPSTRFVLLAGGAAALLVVLAAAGAAAWPEIELRYHRHHYRRGTPEERAEALLWICENRLRAGMSKEEVERVLGEALPGRLSTLGPVVAGPPGATVKSEDFDTRGFGGSGPRVRLSFREGVYLGHRCEQQPLGRY